MGKSSSQPAAPDYVGAANATAAGNLTAAQDATTANRVNSYTPYGSVTYQSGINGNPNEWSSTTSLSPAGQTELNQQNQVQDALSGLGTTVAGQAATSTAAPFDWSALPSVTPNAGATTQQSMLARDIPLLNRQQDQLQTGLTAQGIPQNSEAWNNSLDDFGRSENDTINNDVTAGITADETARQNAIQEQEFGRTESLNLLDALRSGTQITLPSQPTTAQQQTTGGADQLAAANAQYNSAIGAYNANQAGQNQTTSSLYGAAGALGAAGLSAYLRNNSASTPSVGPGTGGLY